MVDGEKVVNDDISFNVADICNTILTRAKETYDEFIFETVEPYCNQVTKQRISKQILKRALIEYFKNHPEEREGR